MLCRCDPHPRRRAVAAGVVSLLLILSAGAPAAQGDNPDMKPVYHFVRLLGTRAGWPDDMTPREEQVMANHFAYLKDLTRKGIVVAAGPVFNPTFGLIILRTGSEAEARALMDSEPSVAAGVHTYELQPMTLSLLADHRSPLRYVSRPSARSLRKEIVVPVSADSAWTLWTTNAGLEAFLVEKANVDLRLGGSFELYFSMASPVGQRGSEDCAILSFLPGRMLSFEWNAPPSFPSRRDGERTWVVVEFEPLAPDRPAADSGVTPAAPAAAQTRITLTHLGWGEGEDWDSLYAYFDRAWGLVLDALREYLAGTAE